MYHKHGEAGIVRLVNETFSHKEFFYALFHFQQLILVLLNSLVKIKPHN